MKFRRSLIALLLLAPHGVWAFGDLDCIGIRTCDGTRCTAPLENYTVTFEWDRNIAIVEFEGSVVTLELASNPVAPDSASGTMFFLAPDAPEGADRGSLILDFSADEITTSFNQRFAGQTYVAACSDQEHT